MESNSSYKVKDWVKDLQKQGRITFPLSEAKEIVPKLSRNCVSDGHFSNDYDLSLKGVKMVPELGIFLKTED